MFAFAGSYSGLASAGLCLGDLPEKRLTSPECHWTEPQK